MRTSLLIPYHSPPLPSSSSSQSRLARSPLSHLCPSLPNPLPLGFCCFPLCHLSPRPAMAAMAASPAVSPAAALTTKPTKPTSSSLRGDFFGSQKLNCPRGLPSLRSNVISTFLSALF
jgi:hypothetical protein